MEGNKSVDTEGETVNNEDKTTTKKIVMWQINVNKI